MRKNKAKETDAICRGSGLSSSMEGRGDYRSTMSFINSRYRATSFA